VLSTDGGVPIFRQNLIRDARGDGVKVGEGGGGVFEGNRVRGNSGAGLRVLDQGRPRFQRNDVNRGNGIGIVLHGGAGGCLDGNLVEGNAGSQLEALANPSDIETELTGNRVVAIEPEVLADSRRRKARGTIGGVSGGAGFAEPTRHLPAVSLPRLPKLPLSTLS